MGATRWFTDSPGSRRYDRPFGARHAVVPCVAVALAALATSSVAQPTKPREDGSGQAPSGTFAPGVRIDWQARAVEVEARVALRAGPLELLACTPNTREHESVLVVLARPMHIYQALGLIGVEPGHPIRYNAKTETTDPPTGQRLTLSVRFREGAKVHVYPARELMRLVGREDPPPTLRWVFAGSRTFPSGRYGADADGTVACVVDFDTAVIALDTRHSADNQQLWLEANTPRIPPVGTPATLIIRALQQGIGLTATLDRDSRLRFEGRVVSPAELAARMRSGSLGSAPLRLILQADPGVTPHAVTNVLRALGEHGVAAGRVELRRLEGDFPESVAGSDDG